jgi:ribonuclease Z
LKITILGTGSATPSLIRNPSAQVLDDDHGIYLIDCGEGTQNQLIKNKIKLTKLKNIFISHLHGDHYFGLIGLISSLNLAQRNEPLNIFGPKGLSQIIQIQLKYSQTFLNFKLTFIEIDTYKVQNIFENEHITISTLPLIHRVPCSGFLFIEKPKKRSIIAEKLPKKIEPHEILTLKNGNNIYDLNNKIIYNFQEFTTEPPLPKKYAYCSDTAYSEAIIKHIIGIDLLYHEATFRNDLAERAKKTLHSTASDAAKIAQKAEVKKLIIGHFSSRYHELDVNLNEAQSIFENTFLAIENETYNI